MELQHCATVTLAELHHWTNGPRPCTCTMRQLEMPDSAMLHDTLLDALAALHVQYKYPFYIQRPEFLIWPCTLVSYIHSGN